MQRCLSEEFLKKLTVPEEVLYPVLHRVRHDHTLFLSIRRDYLNIYYRGGNLLRLTPQRDGSCAAFFDPNYSHNPESLPILPGRIDSLETSMAWIGAFQELKGVMDRYFSKSPKPEREFQQLIARENNFSSISNQSEYFITDIEFADTSLGARIDMLAARWPLSQRKISDRLTPVFIEVKYGDGTLGGQSGLLKHLRDIEKLISDTKRYREILETMTGQLNQFDQMGLLSFNRVAEWKKFTVTDSKKPEVIIIIANHNPRSSRLRKIIGEPEFDRYRNSKQFKLRFYVASFAGYALHSKCMVPLDRFRALVGDSTAM